MRAMIRDFLRLETHLSGLFTHLPSLLNFMIHGIVSLADAHFNISTHSSAFGLCCWQVYWSRKLSITLEITQWHWTEDVSEHWVVTHIVSRTGLNQGKQVKWHSLISYSSSSLISLSALSAELSKYVCHRTIPSSPPTPTLLQTLAELIHLEQNPIFISSLGSLFYYWLTCSPSHTAITIADSSKLNSILFLSLAHSMAAGYKQGFEDLRGK